MSGGVPLRDVPALAHRTVAAGFDGLLVTESGRTPYLFCAAATLSEPELHLATGVAVAFPRSPMVTAATAWELAEATGGRFRLGIGPQVRAHIERRYGAAFTPPGPRLRDYVRAVRAIFAAFRGDAPLDFHGDYHELTLLPAMWSPGPIGLPDPPIDVAAVNPWMLRMAGEVADGVHLHPISTATYLRETVLPNVAAGAERGGRDPRSITYFLPLFTAGGDTDDERARWRETTRSMVAFYGSTPNYGFLFEQLGRPDTTPRLREAQRAGDLAGMTAIIDDELLPHFVVEAPWDELDEAILARCAPLAGHDVNVVLYLAGNAARAKDDTFERFGAVAKRLSARSL
jgi:probable F420-dependent oxidoreductase